VKVFALVGRKVGLKKTQHVERAAHQRCAGAFGFQRAAGVAVAALLEFAGD